MSTITKIKRWADGSHMKGDPEQVAAFIEESGVLQEPSGRLQREKLVKLSKRKKAPTHELFEWDDATAAHEYRVQQAAYIICSIVEVDQDEEGQELGEPTRYFMSTKPDDAEDGELARYVPVTQVQTNGDLSDYIVRQYAGYVRSYATRLRQVEKLVRSMDRILMEMDTVDKTLK